jgi:hypothetical protein
MADDHAARVARIAASLEDLGRAPVLVGGMALVVLGSRRVTRDFDLVIAHPGDRLADVVRVLYRERLHLAARLDRDGQVVATITNGRVAAARLRIDRPSSATFFDETDGLRIDLLFDVPISARTLAADAVRVRLGEGTLAVASEARLLELKRLAAASRDAPGDAEDIRFLARRVRRRGARPARRPT